MTDILLFRERVWCSHYCHCVAICWRFCWNSGLLVARSVA